MTLRFALLAAPFLLAACGNAASKDGAAASEPAPASAEANMELFATDMIVGDAKAPVTMIEYASVTCPHCAAFNEEVIPGIKEKYIDTGKLKLVFREFPTPPANFSMAGSVLARCAAEKSGHDAYFLVTDALFRTQQTWIRDNPREELAKIVGQAGMNDADIEACLQRKDLVEIVNANVKSGIDKYGVQSTPTFILGGKKIAFKTLEEFESQVEAAVKAGAK